MLQGVSSHFLDLMVSFTDHIILRVTKERNYIKETWLPPPSSPHLVCTLIYPPALPPPTLT
jgi:hypothetical protein